MTTATIDEAGTSPRPWQAVAVLAAFVLGTSLLLGFALLYFQGGFADDSYMLFRYARNIVEGNGFAWNPGGAPTAGATSPLYVLLVAAVSGSSGVAAPAASLWVTLTATLLAVAAATLAVWRAAPLGQGWLAGFVPLQAGLDPYLIRYLIRHAVNGMDTAVALAVVALTLLACRSDRVAWPRIATGVLLGGLAYLTRPDLVLLVGSLIGLAILVSPAATRSGHIRALLAYGLAQALLLALLLVAYRSYFGNWLPLSSLMKNSPLELWGSPRLAEWVLNAAAGFIAAFALMIGTAFAGLAAAGRTAPPLLLVAGLGWLVFAGYLLTVAPVMSSTTVTICRFCPVS